MSGPSSIYQDVKALQAVVAALQQANATQSSKIAELEYTAQASGDTGLPRGPDRDARCDRVLAVAPRVCPPRVLDVIGNPPPPLSLSLAAWVLVSATLVLMMTIPGLAFFYGGLAQQVRHRPVWPLAAGCMHNVLGRALPDGVAVLRAGKRPLDNGAVLGHYLCGVGPVDGFGIQSDLCRGQRLLRGGFALLAHERI